MADDTASNYLHDLGVLLTEMALKAKRRARDETGAERKYAMGRAMAFYEVLSLMEQQAEVFELSDADIGLKGIDPDRDLL